MRYGVLLNAHGQTASHILLDLTGSCHAPLEVSDNVDLLSGPVHGHLPLPEFPKGHSWLSVRKLLPSDEKWVEPL